MQYVFHWNNYHSYNNQTDVFVMNGDVIRAVVLPVFWYFAIIFIHFVIKHFEEKIQSDD